MIAKYRPLIANKKVSGGVGHPENKTSFVGFVYSRVGGSPVICALAGGRAGVQGGGITEVSPLMLWRVHVGVRVRGQAEPIYIRKHRQGIGRA